MTNTLDGTLILPGRTLPGRLTFDDRIRSIEHRVGVPSRYILPGFIDGHVHGGGGADTMDGVHAIETLSRFHLAHGTTTILPTTITAPWPEVMTALGAIASVVERGISNGPRVHGAHLEGPFVSPHKLGAQPPFAIAPTPERVDEAIATGCVRVVTLAPELEHAENAMQRFAAADIRVSIGHTTAGYEDTAHAVRCVCGAGGTAGGTHLFNAMSPITGRAPGPVTALMCSDAAFGELILDTHHVHPANFRLVERVMGHRLLLVTDAMRGAGEPEGPSTLGGQAVTIRGGAVRLADGTLAGSILTLDQALRNAVKTGLSLPRAAELVSTNAARYLGLHDRGIIAPDRLADFVILDETLHVTEVWVAGKRAV